MTPLLFFAWWLVGVSGCYLLWLDWKWASTPKRRCPTPKGVLGMVLGGFAGPLTLIMGTTVLVAGFLSNQSDAIQRSTFGKWMNTPLCGEDQ
jgi:hypothetical protein